MRRIAPTLCGSVTWSSTTTRPSAGSSEMSIGASGRASSSTPWWTASRGRRWAISSADDDARFDAAGGDLRREALGGGRRDVEPHQLAPRRLERRRHAVEAVDAHDVARAAVAARRRRRLRLGAFRRRRAPQRRGRRSALSRPPRAGGRRVAAVGSAAVAMGLARHQMLSAEAGSRHSATGASAQSGRRRLNLKALGPLADARAAGLTGAPGPARHAGPGERLTSAAARLYMTAIPNAFRVPAP